MVAGEPGAPSPLVGYLAGGVGGLVVECAYFPIDTLKTRWQSTVCILVGSTHLVHQSVLKNSKWNLFSGIQATALAAFPAGFAYMAGFNWTSSKLQLRLNEHWSNLLGGVAAEFMACFVRTPFEVVKQQLQVGLDSTIAKTVRNIIRSKGILGVYSGILPLLLRDAPYSAIFMPLYYALKAKDDREESVLKHLANCTLAASLAVTFTQPMDVVKTHMMTSRSDKLSFLQTVRKIKADSGIPGFYKAFSLRYANAVYFAMVFICPLMYSFLLKIRLSIFMTVYEYTLKKLTPLMH